MNKFHAFAQVVAVPVDYPAKVLLVYNVVDRDTEIPTDKSYTRTEPLPWQTIRNLLFINEHWFEEIENRLSKGQRADLGIHPVEIDPVDDVKFEAHTHTES